MRPGNLMRESREYSALPCMRKSQQIVAPPDAANDDSMLKGRKLLPELLRSDGKEACPFTTSAIARFDKI